MNLENKSIRLTASNKGEITSLFFNDVNIIREGNNTFDIVWPVTNTSTGFLVNGKNYTFPFHGFWKDLVFTETANENELVFETVVNDKNIYPWKVQITHSIKVGHDNVEIKTVFKNIDIKNLSFMLGYHPYFKVDDSSEIKFDGKQRTFDYITPEGKYIREEKQMHKIVDSEFRKHFGTLVVKEHNYDKISLNYNTVKINISHNFDSTQIWTGNCNEFICIEPWQGWNDLEYDAPNEPKLKWGVINLQPNESVVKWMKINFINQ